MGVGQFEGADGDVYVLYLKDDFTATSQKIKREADSLRASLKSLGAKEAGEFKKDVAITEGWGKRVRRMGVNQSNALKMDRAISASNAKELRAMTLAHLQALKMDRAMSTSNTKQLRAMTLAHIQALKMNSVLDAQKAHVNSLAGAWEGLHKKMSGAESIFQSILGPIKVGIGLMTAFSALTTGLAVKLVKSVIDNSRLRQTATNAMTFNLGGDAVAAKELYDWSAHAALNAGAPVEKMADYAKELTGYGFNSHDTKVFAAMAMDQEARMGPGYDKKFINAVAAIQARGYSALGDVGRRGRLHAAGVRADLIVPELETLLNLPKVQGRDAKLEKMLKDGVVSKETLFQAVYNAQTKQYGLPGTAAKAQTKTLGGSIDQLKNSLDYLVNFSDIDKSPGLKTLGNFIQRFTRMFTDMQGVGGKFMESIGRGLKLLLGGLDQLEDSDIEKFILGLGTTFEDMMKNFRTFYDLFVDFLHSDMTVTELAGSTFIEIGELIWEGFKGGLLGTSHAKLGKYTLNEHTFGKDEVNYGLPGGNTSVEQFSQIEKLAVDRGFKRKPGATLYGDYEREVLTFMNAQVDKDRKEAKRLATGAAAKAGVGAGAPEPKVLNDLDVNVNVTVEHKDGQTDEDHADMGKKIGQAAVPSFTSMLERVNGR